MAGGCAGDCLALAEHERESSDDEGRLRGYEVYRCRAREHTGDDRGEHDGNRASPQGLRRREGGHASRGSFCGRGGIVQHDPRFADVAQPPPDVPIETPRYQTPHRHGRRRGERRPIDVLAQDRRERVGNIIALERALARQHLVEHRAERPHVAPLVSLASLRLLWAHVRGRAENNAHPRHSGTGDRRRRGHVCAWRRDGLHRLREAEVQHFHRAVGSQLDIRGLQIAVDDPLLVGRFERLGDLPRDGQRLIEGIAPSRDAVRERRSFDQFQHERLHGWLP